jgi:hypothetical protein
MVTLHFQYHEIMDADWTAITVEVVENGQLTHTFRNYKDKDLGADDIYGNQCDSFQLPDVQTALAMIRSNDDYYECDQPVLLRRAVPKPMSHGRPSLRRWPSFVLVHDSLRCHCMISGLKIWLYFVMSVRKALLNYDRSG